MVNSKLYSTRRPGMLSTQKVSPERHNGAVAWPIMYLERMEIKKHLYTVASTVKLSRSGLTSAPVDTHI